METYLGHSDLAMLVSAEMMVVKTSAAAILRLIQLAGRLYKARRISEAAYRDITRFARDTGGDYTLVNLPAASEEEARAFSQTLKGAGIMHCPLPDLDTGDGLMQAAIRNQDLGKWQSIYERYVTAHLTGGKIAFGELNALTAGAYDIKSLKIGDGLLAADALAGRIAAARPPVLDGDARTARKQVIDAILGQDEKALDALRESLRAGGKGGLAEDLDALVGTGRRERESLVDDLTEALSASGAAGRGTEGPGAPLRDLFRGDEETVRGRITDTVLNQDGKALESLRRLLADTRSNAETLLGRLERLKPADPAVRRAVLFTRCLDRRQVSYALMPDLAAGDGETQVAVARTHLDRFRAATEDFIRQYKEEASVDLSSQAVKDMGMDDYLYTGKSTNKAYVEGMDEGTRTALDEAVREIRKEVSGERVENFNQALDGRAQAETYARLKGTPGVKEVRVPLSAVEGYDADASLAFLKLPDSGGSVLVSAVRPPGAEDGISCFLSADSSYMIHGAGDAPEGGRAVLSAEEVYASLEGGYAVPPAAAPEREAGETPGVPGPSQDPGTPTARDLVPEAPEPSRRGEGRDTMADRLAKEARVRGDLDKAAGLTEGQRERYERLHRIFEEAKVPRSEVTGYDAEKMHGYARIPGTEEYISSFMVDGGREDGLVSVFFSLDAPSHVFALDGGKMVEQGGSQPSYRSLYRYFQDSFRDAVTPAQDRIPVPEPEDMEVPVPEPEDMEVPVPEPEGMEIPVPEPEDMEIPVPEPEDMEVPVPEPEGMEIPVPEPEGMEVPVPEPEDMEIPVPEPEDMEVPVPEPEGMEVPVPEPEDMEIPVPEPEDMEVPVPEPEGMEVPVPEPEDMEIPVPEPDDAEKELFSRMKGELDAGLTPYERTHIRELYQASLDIQVPRGEIMGYDAEKMSGYVRLPGREGYALCSMADVGRTDGMVTCFVPKYGMALQIPVRAPGAGGRMTDVARVTNATLYDSLRDAWGSPAAALAKAAARAYAAESGKGGPRL